MRVADSSVFRQFLANLTAQNSVINRSLQQLADQKRIRVASDDPAAARISLVLRGEIVRNEGFRRSADTAGVDLSTIEASVDQIIDVLIAAKGEASRFDAGGAATSTVVEVIDSARADVIRFANVSQNGRYLFSGTNTLTPPYDDTGTYAGNAEATLANLDEDQTVAVTVAGDAFFQSAAGDVFATLENLSAAVAASDSAGIRAGIDELNAEIEHLIQSRSTTGVRLQQIDRAKIRIDDERLALQTRIADLEDVDLAEAATQLAQANSSVEALSQAASRVLGRSLFDFLG